MDARQSITSLRSFPPSLPGPPHAADAVLERHASHSRRSRHQFAENTHAQCELASNTLKSSLRQASASSSPSRFKDLLCQLDCEHQRELKAARAAVRRPSKESVTRVHSTESTRFNVLAESSQAQAAGSQEEEAKSQSPKSEATEKGRGSPRSVPQELLPPTRPGFTSASLVHQTGGARDHHSCSSSGEQQQQRRSGLSAVSTDSEKKLRLSWKSDQQLVPSMETYGALTSSYTSLRDYRMSEDGTCSQEIVFALLRPWQDIMMDEITHSSVTQRYSTMPMKLEGTTISNMSRAAMRTSTVSKRTEDTADGRFPDADGHHAGKRWFRGPWIIHPSSTRRLIWDVMAMWLVAYDVITIPLQVFDLDPNWFTDLILFASQCFWTLDLVLAFFTAYHKKGCIITRPRQIACHYLKTWFLFDLIVVTVDWTIWWTRLASEGYPMARWLRVTKFARFLRASRLLRLMKLRRIINEIRDRIDSESMSTYFQVISSLLVILAINHVVACAWYGLSTFDIHEGGGLISWVQLHEMMNVSKEYLYTTSLHWSVTQFTPASMSVQPSNVLERTFSIVVVLFGLVIFSSFVSHLTTAMAHLRKLKNEQSRQFWLLRRYLKGSGVSRKLSLRIQRYLEFVHQTQGNTVRQEEVVILRLLSEPLQNELRLGLHKALFNRLPIFKYLQNSMKETFMSEDYSRVMLKVCNNMLAPKPLAKGDTVFFHGEVGEYVLINTIGSLRYRRPRFDDSSHVFSDTIWICEHIMWTAWVHVGDLQAADDAHMMKLDPNKLVENLRNVPTVSRRAASFGERFIAALNRTPVYELSDIDTSFFRWEALLARRIANTESGGAPFGGSSSVGWSSATSTGWIENAGKGLKASAGEILNLTNKLVIGKKACESVGEEETSAPQHLSHPASSDLAESPHEKTTFRGP